MSKTIHIVTAFSRGHLFDTHVAAYGPMGVIWHPVVFESEKDIVSSPFPWVRPFIIPDPVRPLGWFDVGYHKKNEFIKGAEIADDDYYMVLDDDDSIEPEAVEALKGMDNDIVIISMKRGYHIPRDVIPERFYPVTTLIASPDNVQIGMISNQQYITKGAIFKTLKFDTSEHCADGYVAIDLKERYPIRYEPTLYALFNFYEPGRWDNPYKIEFGCMVNDWHRFDMCLRQSQLSDFTLQVLHNPETACKGLNILLDKIDRGGNDIAILAHQDMYFTSAWVQQMLGQIAMLPDSWIVAGIIGKDVKGRVCGKMQDMRMPLKFVTAHLFPAPASCFDECVIIVNLKKGFRFLEDMPGFDLYGTLAVCQAWEMGGTAWVIDAFAEHYCTRSFSWRPGQEFEDCFKWLHERFPARVAERIDTTVLPVKGGLPRYDAELGDDDTNPIVNERGYREQRASEMALQNQ
ncbi:MAG: hypothetical protein A4E65_03690 [Syntrophorhabdus sp. PtaU1.Bin153]|nr:MAG: hypothetical protein A4E65_03690 [Syntrophorhabdus sp. PtaU1.Bin153]